MKILLKNGKLSFALLLLMTFILILITEHRILTVGFYQQNGEILSGIPGQAPVIYQGLQKWIYLSAAVYLLVRISVITLILQTALYLHDEQTGAGAVFRVCILAEFVFLIPAILKVFTFPYTHPSGTLLDWQRYSILSLLAVFGNVPADWFYALQSLNLFETAYWFVLAWGITKISSLNYDRALRLIMCSYIPALVIWLTAVTFFTLLLFPATG